MLLLPWPDKSMSPNSRKHRLAVAPVRARYRNICKIRAMNAQMNFAHLADVGLHLRITFHPPCIRKRDIDNMLGAFKSGLDGLSDAFGVDDSKWEITIRRGVAVKDGHISVEVISTGSEYVWRGA